MPHKIGERVESVCLVSMAEVEKMEERDLLKAQMLSMGINPERGQDQDQDGHMDVWANAQLQELLDARNAGIRPDQLHGRGQSGESEDHARVILERHVRGVNDMMLGVLPPPPWHSSEPEDATLDDLDDCTVSVDTLPRLYRSMPHYMVSVKMLRTWNLFHDPSFYDVLPDDFFTTVKGLKLAWDEADAAQPDPDQDMDGYLLEALLKRGGFVENSFSNVQYPADIVPSDGGRGDPAFWAELHGMKWDAR